MPVDNFKPKGPSKLNNPNSGGGNNKQYPIIGVVKDNIDPTRSGRIRVALQDGQGPTNPDKSGGWTTVQYLSTYFGSIGSSSGNDKENYGTYKNNPSSYGQWQAPPDIGTKVVCIFVNGDLSAGFYIGSIPEPETLQMVPAIGASDTVTLNEGEANGFGGATRLPVTNLNTNNKDKADSNQFLDTPRPVHSYTASVMSQQGIIRDPVRGPISSSASREAASRVGWGVSTPGRPIYEGGYDDENLPDNLEQSKGEQLKVISRRGGHSLVMDDGDIIGRDQLIRIRTALGHQILMSDDGQTLMLLHSNGQSYIELGKEGTVDIFSTNSINLRTQGDFNVHADRDINLHAMEKLNIQAKNIHVNSEEETKFRAGKDYRIEALSNYTVKAASAFAVKSGGEASMVAGGQAFVNGSKVNLNSGSPGLSPATVPIITLTAQTDTLFEEEKGWAAAPGKLLSIASRTPAHFPWAGAGIGVDIKTSGNASDNLPKAPSAAVQAVNNTAAASGATPPNTATVASVPSTAQVSGALDKNTTGAVLGAVATTAATGATAVAVAGGAAIIPTSAGGKVSGLIGEINKVAGQASQVVAGVNNIVNQASTAVTQAAVAVGSFAQTPQQLTQSGILKPGSSTLIHGLASAGKSIINAVPDTLFTGKAGAENITSLVKNADAQAQSVVSVMQSAQKALGQAGILTGKESSTQTAGLVTAVSTAGISQTINVVNAAAGTAKNLVNSASSVANSLANATNGVSTAIATANGAVSTFAGAAAGATSGASNLVGQLQNTANQVSGLADKAGSVLSAVGAGNQAANLANSLGGLGGIANALKGMGDSSNGPSLTGLLDSVKGIAGSAFDAIVKGFPKLEANVPQYLSDFAKKAATKAAVVSSTVPGGATNLAEDALADAAASATGELISVGEGLTDDINNTVAGITGSLQNPVNVTTEGVSSTIKNNSSTVSTSSIINTVNQTSTLVNNVTSAAGSITSTTTNLINSVTGTSSSTSKIVNNVNTVVNEINGLSGAAQSLKGGITSLANAAKSVQAGGGSAKASALSSGINNLPGGIKSISSVLDKATGAINKIPGTGELSGLLKNAQTDVQNGIASVNGVLNDISSITNKAGGIGAAIASKLPLGEASQLLSALSALGSGGSSPIKLPDLGFNTLNRSELTSQVNKLIGDLGIPKPNFVGGVKDETVDNLLQKLIDAGEKRKQIQQKYDALNEEFKAADKDFDTKYSTLPEGDPAVEAAFVKLKDLAGKLSLAIDELEGADAEYNTAAANGLRDTPGGRLFGI
jgi:hypothetical protein